MIERAKLGDVADFINGVAFKPADWGDTGRKIIRIQNLTDPSKPYNLTQRQVAPKYEVMPGDLLVSWSATLGVFSWQGPDTALVNQHIFRVVPDRSRVHPNYLRHMLQDALIEMERHLHGATMKHVNRGEFLATTIPIPPLEEQERIAAILDAADDLRTKRRESLAQLDTLLQSTFLDLFGDPVTNPKGWEEKPLSEVVRPGTIVTYGIVQAGKEFPGGVPYIRTGDIIDGEIVEDGLRHTDPAIASKFDRSRVDEGDIVMSIRATVGTTAVVPASLDGANLTQGTAKIAPGPEADLLYLLHYIRSHGAQRWIQRQIKGATFKEITLGRLRQLPVLLPPIKLQKQFGEIAEAIEERRTQERNQLAELDTLFASLQSRAFRGEL